jgi:hypothetical protein
MASGGGCVLVLLCFSASVAVWGKRKSPHMVHGSMLNRQACECETMQKLQKPTHHRKQRKDQKRNSHLNMEWILLEVTCFMRAELVVQFFNKRFST